MSLKTFQAELMRRGHDLGSSGADGKWGPLTEFAAFDEIGHAKPAGADVIPPEWMPPADMKRIIVHWTAGIYKATSVDRQHYHILIEGDGKLQRGLPTIDLNDASGTKPGYAAHTLHCNSGSIGVSLCGMWGAVESPFKPGPYPLTETQWDVLPAVLATLCRRYDIPVTQETVLSHAEVQPTLGIAQSGKWDITRLPFDPGVGGAVMIGDLLRDRTRAAL